MFRVFCRLSRESNLLSLRLKRFLLERSELLLAIYQGPYSILVIFQLLDRIPDIGHSAVHLFSGRGANFQTWCPEPRQSLDGSDIFSSILLPEVPNQVIANEDNQSPLEIDVS